jgi:hypothetical protein
MRFILWAVHTRVVSYWIWFDIVECMWPTSVSFSVHLSRLRKTYMLTWLSLHVAIPTTLTCILGFVFTVHFISVRARTKSLRKHPMTVYSCVLYPASTTHCIVTVSSYGAARVPYVCSAPYRISAQQLLHEGGVSGSWRCVHCGKRNLACCVGALVRHHSSRCFIYTNCSFWRMYNLLLCICPSELVSSVTYKQCSECGTQFVIWRTEVNFWQVLTGFVFVFV